MRPRSNSWKICGTLAGLVAVAALVGGLACLRQSPPAAEVFPIQFQDVTNDSGITFLHTDGSSGRRYIVESMSTGIATLDYDGDGLIDVYFPNGGPLPGARYDKPPRHALYRNLGDWRFLEVTDQAGVPATAFGLGITIGDYDADGWPDIYLNNFGPGILFHNNGDGTYHDVTQAAGVAVGSRVGAGACFLDVDGDGLLDLYVGNYIHLDLSKHVPRTSDGHPSYPSPKEYEPLPTRCTAITATAPLRTSANRRGSPGTRADRWEWSALMPTAMATRMSLC